jgi:hypothetical protein
MLGITQKQTNEDLRMENKVVKEIIDYARKKLNSNYGFCGVAEGHKNAMLNSSDEKGNEIKIIIKVGD